MRSSMRNVPYHNWRHVVDVTHSTYRFLRLVDSSCCFSLLEQLALLTAAMCHDMDHPGKRTAAAPHLRFPAGSPASAAAAARDLLAMSTCLRKLLRRQMDMHAAPAVKLQIRPHQSQHYTSPRSCLLAFGNLRVKCCRKAAVSCAKQVYGMEVLKSLSPNP